jgi:hypothetical protein
MLVGGGIYTLLVLIGFCFGVWAGNDKQKPIETAAAAPAPVPQPPAPQPAAPQPQPPAPQPAPPQPMPQPMVTPVPMPAPIPKPPEPNPPEKAKMPEPKPVPKVRQVLFEKDVLPIFKSKCILCHGGVKDIKGDLDLRNLAAIMKGGISGDALIPGNLKDSAIWYRVEDLTMPPAGKERLTADEIQIIKDWILSGGK